MRRRLVFPALLAVVLMSAAPARAAVISFDSVLTGSDPFTLDIRVSDVTDLYSFGFDLFYNPTVLNLLSVTEGSFLASGLTGGSTFFIANEGIPSDDRAVMSIGGTFVPFPDLQPFGASGSGVLASFTFLAVNLGATGVEVANVLLFDSREPDPNDPLANQILPVDTVQGNVAVPEPSTLLLIGLGLAAAARRRRRANGQGNLS